MTGSRRQGMTSGQPGFPAGEARLLDVRQEGESIFFALDSGEKLEVTAGSVPDMLPEVGQILPAGVLAALRNAAERKQVARRALSLLDRRMLPVARLRSKLLEAGFHQEAIEEVLDQMADRGYYSDRHFAEAWCRDCLSSRCVGRYYLLTKLRQKQVSGDIARAVVGEFLDDETEADLARRAAQRRRARLQGEYDRRAEASVVRFLQSRGFPGPLAGRVARNLRPSPSAGEQQEES